jgi:hypothetical protein
VDDIVKKELLEWNISSFLWWFNVWINRSNRNWNKQNKRII